MNPYKLPYFEPFDLDDLQDHYEVEVPFEGRQLSIDLNFDDGAKPTVDKLDLIKHQLENLADLHRRNQAAIDKDYADGSEVRYYITEHLGHLDEDDLAETLRRADKSKTPALQMLESFYLKRVGFYPEIESAIVSDYTVNQDCIDDLIVIFRRLDGSLDGITIES